MTSKKPKGIQMLTSSSRKEQPEKHIASVEPIEPKTAGHHRTQQSMDNSTMPFKVSKILEIRLECLLEIVSQHPRFVQIFNDNKSTRVPDTINSHTSLSDLD